MRNNTFLNFQYTSIIFINTFLHFSFSLSFTTLQLDGLKHVTDAHQFPEDEEPNILGHGTPMEEKSDPLTTEKSMKLKTVLNFEDVSE